MESDIFFYLINLSTGKSTFFRYKSIAASHYEKLSGTRFF